MQLTDLVEGMFAKKKRRRDPSRQKIPFKFARQEVATGEQLAKGKKVRVTESGYRWHYNEKQLEADKALTIGILSQKKDNGNRT